MRDIVMLKIMDPDVSQKDSAREASKEKTLPCQGPLDIFQCFAAKSGAEPMSICKPHQLRTSSFDTINLRTALSTPRAIEVSRPSGAWKISIEHPHDISLP